MIVVASDFKAGYLFILICIIFIFLEHPQQHNSTHKYMLIFSLNLEWFVSIDNNTQTTPLSFTIPISPLRACCSFFRFFLHVHPINFHTIDYEDDPLWDKLVNPKLFKTLYVLPQKDGTKKTKKKNK